MFNTNPYDVQTTQPGSLDAPGATPVNGVTVRTISDTPEDTAYVAKVLVEAFEGKFVHCVTREKLPVVEKIVTSFYSGQYPEFYSHNFLAEMGGRPVGFMQVKFKDEKIVEKSDHLCELGCWHACRFMWLDCVMGSKVEEHSKCLLECICVDAMARGKGVGKLLLDRAEYEARRRGCTMIYLIVLTTNRAKNLYERQGYRITETHGNCCIKCTVGSPGSYNVMEKPLV